MQGDDTIDCEILAVRAAQAARGAVDITAEPIAVGRGFINDTAMQLNDGLPELPSVSTFTIDGPAGPMRARLYCPGQPAGGAVLYAHGGGWFACNVDTHDRMLRQIAAESGLPVLGMDYRLAPEHPYPAALQDLGVAWRWLRANIGTIPGVVSDRIVVAGDSAGANLALAAMLAERAAGRPMPAGAALLYGTYSPADDNDSHRRFGSGGYGLTTARVTWYWANYLGAHRPEPPFLATPIEADLAGLAPHFIGIASLDVLADENRRLAERLRHAGVPVRLREWQRATHGFLQMTRDVALARAAVSEIADVLKQMIAGH
jgi:acetyl esterase